MTRRDQEGTASRLAHSRHGKAHTVVTVVGARPQFVKAAVVSRALDAFDQITHLLVHTGQHYSGNMSQVFFDDLAMPAPDFNLGVGSGPHGEQTGRMLVEIERLLVRLDPDLVLVYGDTNSTLAAALAAAKLHIPIAHVEAGLRSFNRSMPEEVNRVLTDHCSDLLFAPTTAAVANLAREGIPGDRIRNVGDVMLDATRFAAERTSEPGTARQRFSPPAQPFILATIHRAENTEDPHRLRCILEALASISRDIDVVLPLHPRTRGAIEALGLQDTIRRHHRLRVVDPVGYFEMQALEHQASVIVTDSGGVQKEAYFHEVPCVTLRDETEWVELVQAGWNTLVPPVTADAIEQAIRCVLVAAPPDTTLNYGDGCSGSLIAQEIAQFFSDVADRR